jgi:hypothetical protein
MIQKFFFIVFVCFAIIIISNIYDFSNIEGLAAMPPMPPLPPMPPPRNPAPPPPMPPQGQFNPQQMPPQGQFNPQQMPPNNNADLVNQLAQAKSTANQAIAQAQNSENQVRVLNQQLAQIKADTDSANKKQKNAEAQVIQLNSAIISNQKELSVANKNYNVESEAHRTLAEKLDIANKKISEMDEQINLNKPLITVVDYINNAFMPLYKNEAKINGLYKDLQDKFMPQNLDNYTMTTTRNAINVLTEEINTVIASGPNQSQNYPMNVFLNNKKIIDFINLASIQDTLSKSLPILNSHTKDDKDKLYIPAKNAVDLMTANNLIRNK